MDHGGTRALLCTKWLYFPKYFRTYCTFGIIYLRRLFVVFIGICSYVWCVCSYVRRYLRSNNLHEGTSEVRKYFRTNFRKYFRKYESTSVVPYGNRLSIQYSTVHELYTYVYKCIENRHWRLAPPLRVGSWEKGAGRGSVFILKSTKVCVLVWK